MTCAGWNRCPPRAGYGTTAALTATAAAHTYRSNDPGPRLHPYIYPLFNISPNP